MLAKFKTQWESKEHFPEGFGKTNKMILQEHQRMKENEMKNVWQKKEKRKI